MKTYLVGGAVRDMLMGLEPKDQDYVVVGATPSQMIELGYHKVGSSFPVFLKNNCEYALARTERKTGVGYNGFDVDYNPNVTLEQDLLRRDLTINSIAQDPETGELVDPYGGLRDIKNKMLRHTSEAFAEDPIRVLRVARFAARYPDFSVDPQTLDLMATILPELQYVPYERIWTELDKGMQEKAPYRMFEILNNVGAFSKRKSVLWPYGEATTWTPQQWINMQEADDQLAAYACILKGFVESAERNSLFQQYCVPVHYYKPATALWNNHTQIMKYLELTIDQKLTLFNNIRAFTDASTLKWAIGMLANLDQSFDYVGVWTYVTRDLNALSQLDLETVATKATGNKAVAIYQARYQCLAQLYE